MTRYPYRQFPHRFAGSCSERQSVGDPGHCEACCSVGHVQAHPDLGCADVGCDLAHPEPAVTVSAVQDWLAAHPPSAGFQLQPWQAAYLLFLYQRNGLIR
ncbi:hypothetical protein JNUCC0626_18480 [Lentzea sp. JNUCC 0626]|uniref:hypothetical protein n=1 Tax=Lentzea sp. JNUCC 0626 TaxID=3367513 RepID=UPI003749965E